MGAALQSQTRMLPVHLDKDDDYDEGDDEYVDGDVDEHVDGDDDEDTLNLRVEKVVNLPPCSSSCSELVNT